MILTELLCCQMDAVGQNLPEMTFTYSHIECILYALGVGMSTKEPDHLKFLYENHADFSVLPTFGVIPSQASMMSGGLSSLPGLNIDMTRVKQSSCLPTTQSHTHTHTREHSTAGLLSQET